MKKLLIILAGLLLYTKAQAAFPIVPVIISTGTLQQGTTVYVSSITATNIWSTGTITGSTITTPTFWSGASSTTISGSTFSVTATTGVISSTVAFTNPLYAYTTLASSGVASGTTFRACVSTLTITNPATVNIPIEVHGFWDFGNNACAGGGNGLFWILEDGAYIGSENSTTPRWTARNIGSNDMLMSVNDVITGVTPGTHNFCMGFDGSIGGCGTFFINDTLTGSNWFIKAVQ